MSLLRNQTEHLTLARPFDREVAKSGHAHSVGKAPIDGRLDEIGREERERDRHVDLPHGALLTSGVTQAKWPPTNPGRFNPSSESFRASVLSLSPGLRA